MWTPSKQFISSNRTIDMESEDLETQLMSKRVPQWQQFHDEETAKLAECITGTHSTPAEHAAQIARAKAGKRGEQLDQRGPEFVTLPHETTEIKFGGEDLQGKQETERATLPFKEKDHDEEGSRVDREKQQGQESQQRHTPADEIWAHQRHMARMEDEGGPVQVRPEKTKDQ